MFYRRLAFVLDIWFHFRPFQRLRSPRLFSSLSFFNIEPIALYCCILCFFFRTLREEKNFMEWRPVAAFYPCALQGIIIFFVIIVYWFHFFSSVRFTTLSIYILPLRYFIVIAAEWSSSTTNSSYCLLYNSYISQVFCVCMLAWLESIRCYPLTKSLFFLHKT